MLHKMNIPVSEDGIRVVSLPTKFHLQWTGPHEVVRIVTDNVIVIRVTEKDYKVSVANVLHYEPFIPGKIPKILSKAAELHLHEDARNVMWKKEIHDDDVYLNS